MKATIKEIARICGVSSGTVDRALNNRPGISEKTKKKIVEVAKELNYQPDFTARSLVMGRTMTIGIVLFDLYNRSFAQLMNAIEANARKRGYFVYITLTDKNPESEKKCIEYLINRKVDGIILFSVNQGETFSQYLSQFKTPIITIFNYVSDQFEYIGIKEREAMKNAVEYMVNKKYKRFIYISPPLAFQGKSNIYTQEERLKGFLEGLTAGNIAIAPEIIKDRNYIDILSAIELKTADQTAIVCSCDLYALEVMNYLKAIGLHIPKDVGVFGFDDIDMLKYITPRLTTVQYPIEEIGEMAITSMIQRIEQGSFLHIPLLDYKMIEGESI